MKIQTVDIINKIIEQRNKEQIKYTKVNMHNDRSLNILFKHVLKRPRKYISHVF